MKKILVILVLLASIFMLVSCGGNYIGPRFSGVSLDMSQEAQNAFGLSSKQKDKSILLSSTTSSLKENAPSVIAGLNIVFRESREYLVLNITNPEDVEGEYVFVSVTVSSNKWSSDIKFNNSKDDHRIVQSTDGSKIYLQIIIERGIGEQEIYTIKAIQYIDGDKIKDVRFETDAEDTLILTVGARGARPGNHISIDLENKTLNLSLINEDRTKILGLYINNQQINDAYFGTLETTHAMSAFDISELYVPYTWARIDVIYEVIPSSLVIEGDSKLIQATLSFIHNDHDVYIYNEDDLLFAVEMSQGITFNQDMQIKLRDDIYITKQIGSIYQQYITLTSSVKGVTRYIYTDINTVLLDHPENENAGLFVEDIEIKGNGGLYFNLFRADLGNFPQGSTGFFVGLP